MCDIINNFQKLFPTNYPNTDLRIILKIMSVLKTELQEMTFSNKLICKYSRKITLITFLSLAGSLSSWSPGFREPLRRNNVQYYHTQDIWSIWNKFLSQGLIILRLWHFVILTLHITSHIALHICTSLKLVHAA